jgi:hypothetical protein
MRATVLSKEAAIAASLFEDVMIDLKSGTNGKRKRS